jgi:hypothetical protein
MLSISNLMSPFPFIIGRYVSIYCALKASSPACTELESLVMDWLGKMIGLPSEFLHARSDSLGGGVIQVWFCLTFLILSSYCRGMPYYTCPTETRQIDCFDLFCFLFTHIVYTSTVRKIVPFCCWCVCIVYYVDDSQWIDIRGLIGRTDGGHKTLQNPISRSGRRWNQQPSSGLLLWPGNIKIKPMDSFFYRWMTQALVLFDVDRLTAQ